MLRQTFRFQHRVTYSDCTAGNHIYYARYLDILEAARGEFFRDIGESFAKWQEADTIFPVIDCHLRYRSPARYDDLLAVDLWVTQMEKVRLAFSYRITNQTSSEILVASSVHVCASLQEKPKRLPEELTEKLRPYFEPPVAGA